MKLISAFLAGVLFGAGLVLSGMTNLANVLAFLDVAGDWNPALALTMGGAIAVAAPAFYYHRRQRVDSLDSSCASGDPRAEIDRQLLVGAGIFGVGWGLSGICPGPGLVLLTTLAPGAFVFVASMIAGMFLARRAVRDRVAEPSETDLSPAGD